MPDSLITIHTDGGARGNPGPAASGVLIEQDGKELARLSEYLGTATNNEAEYKAFLLSLQWLQEHQPTATKVQWLLDSMLVVEQLQRHWKIKEARLLAIAQACWKIMDTLPYQTSIGHVARKDNAIADSLVNQELDSQPIA
ncbi:MAG: ribonuclease HI family protein [bacterium]|nr:ribonuclease HI family protein [bacterium]